MEKLPEFLEIIVRRDERFGKSLIDCMNQAWEDGALSKKIKTLMMLALDTAAEHPGGPKELAAMARKMGATEKEITETLEIVAISKCFQGLETGILAAAK